MKGKTVLVTGASRGLGRAYAEELSKRNMNTVLVSSPNGGLPELAASLSKSYGTTCDFYETDLTKKDNILALAQWVISTQNISVLINNVGMGGTQHFLDATANELDDIIQLNARTTAILTHQLLPHLMKQEQSYVLNVCSIAARLPLGYKTVYPATQSFIYSFTRGLQQEFSASNVFFSVVIAGPMKTNEEVSKRIEGQGWLGRISVMEPEKVAARSLKRMFKKDPFIMLTPLNSLQWFLGYILPGRWSSAIFSRIVRRELRGK